MRYSNDKRMVMTLDAGGTNFVFGAMQAEKEIIKPIRVSAKGENLESVLRIMIDGFKEVRSNINADPVAISFAFPGPADYENGIIGDLQNLPLFRGGVALKAMLENEFNIPTFINNDGDLIAYAIINQDKTIIILDQQAAHGPVGQVVFICRIYLIPYYFRYHTEHGPAIKHKVTGLY